MATSLDFSNQIVPRGHRHAMRILWPSKNMFSGGKMNPRCPECGLYELNDGSEDTLWTCECEIEDTPATPTAPVLREHDTPGAARLFNSAKSEPIAPEPNKCDKHFPGDRLSCPDCTEYFEHFDHQGELRKPNTFAEARDRAAEEYTSKQSCKSLLFTDIDFKAGADWGYAKGQTTYSASELEMAKHRAQEKRASLFGELVVKEEIDRLRADNRDLMRIPLEQAEQIAKLTAELAELRENDFQETAMDLMKERDELRAEISRYQHIVDEEQKHSRELKAILDSFAGINVTGSI